MTTATTASAPPSRRRISVSPTPFAPQAVSRLALPPQSHPVTHWQTLDVSWDYSTARRHFEEASTVTMPDAAQWGRAVALATVEVLSGRRPAAQLERWLVTDLYAALVRRVELNERLSGRARGGVAPRVSSSRVCHVNDDVAETTHTITIDARLHAIGVRLERFRHRWIATAIEIV